MAVLDADVVLGGEEFVADGESTTGMTPNVFTERRLRLGFWPMGCGLEENLLVVMLEKRNGVTELEPWPRALRVLRKFGICRCTAPWRECLRSGDGGGLFFPKS
jgi:hypothetical protein